MPNAHPNWFHTVTRERYGAALDSLSVRLPGLNHHQIVVELACIMASVGEYRGSDFPAVLSRAPSSRAP